MEVVNEEAQEDEKAETETSTKPVQILNEAMKPEIRQALKLFAKQVGTITWNKENLNDAMKKVCAESGVKFSDFAGALRKAIIGDANKAPVSGVLFVLGREEVLKRIEGNSMNPVIQQQLERAYKAHLDGNLNEAEVLYNSILNNDMENPTVLYLLGNVYSQRGFNGVAVNLLVNCLQAKPDFQEAWIDMGVALKKENRDDVAMQAWKRAEELGEHHEIYVNQATLYADSGEPEKAIPLCDKTIKMLEKDVNDKTKYALASAHWNKALALLSLQRWEEAWKEHHWRKQLKDVWNPRSEIDAPDWDGKPVTNLFLHGEQGKGDEIMYLSMLKDCLPLAKHIVIELNDAVAPLLRQMEYPTVTVVTDQKQANALGIKFDAKYAIGDLGCLFRNKAEDFDGKAYLKADPERVEYYRNELNKLGPGPYVGIAWTGGTKTTRIQKRSIGLSQWKDMLNGVTPVSLQYGPFGDAEAKKHGIAVFDEASNGTDLLEQAALIEACDYVITVQQTVVHLAGALGKKTYVMVCNAPSWRYGDESTGDKMPWYESVTMIRQNKDDGWENVIDRVRLLVNEDMPTVQNNERLVKA